MITSVKEQRDIETNELTGYLVNGNKYIVLSGPWYLAVQDWIAAGNTPDSAFTNLQIQDATITHYKGLYTGIVSTKLEELDYDSLATVNLWKDDPTYGAEATRILDWYKAIIKRNYELLNAGVLLTDAEYLAEINAVTF